MIYSSSLLENTVYSIDIDLVKDLTEISKKRLKSMGYMFNDNADEDWIRLYFNAQKRLISNTPRAVIKSAEFQCPDKFIPALNEIENKFKKGESLTPYMTTHIKYSKEKDLLLYDWGIYHFHLGLKDPQKQFAERSDQVLFVYIKNNTAYFIQTYPHKKKHLYATQEMVKILHNNWPELIAKHKINGVLSHEIDDENYGKIRKAHISTFVEVGGNAMYAILGGGYASDGSSLEVTHNADYWKNLMRNYQKAIVSEARGILNAIEQFTDKPLNKNLIMKMICLNDDEISLFEENNRVCLQFYKEKTFYRICFPEDLFREQENYRWTKMR